MEVGVRPNGIASAFSKSYPGSISDRTILYERLPLHINRLKKRENEDCDDDFHLSQDFPNHWAALMDKGYQGATENTRAVIPKKKPPRGVLENEDIKHNRKLSSAGIIVENYFGRLGQLWAILSRKWL